MSFLTPLYILGGLAIVGPILFHLIRRSPQGETPFSSLMFLAPTPPRITRRSRLEDLLLLALRAAALALLAFAFARPFLREVARLDSTESAARRTVILIDTSASMRRGDLFERARTLAAETIAEARPEDQLAILAFDRASRPVMGFAESASLDSARQKALATARLDELVPSWAATDLGQALIDAVAAIEDVADTSSQEGRIARRIVLISDLQQGSRLDALGLFEWPSDVALELKTVADNRPNAGLERLADATDGRRGDGASPAFFRVRVSNEAKATREHFQLVWQNAAGKAVGRPVSVYVPAGQSRVTSLRRPQNSSRLTIEGDAHEFDNVLFLADEQTRDAIVLYAGDDKADDPAGLLYYLERVFEESVRHPARVERSSLDESFAADPKAVPLVIVAGAIADENIVRLKSYVQAGGTVLCVLRSTDDAASFAGIAGVPLADVAEADVTGDVMLGEIDFSHPLFAPLAGAEYNDFTKIRFWKYRRLDEESLGEARIVARFENRDPAIVEEVVGKGRVVALASGWQPADSQLARSTKFVPLMIGLLERRSARAIDATSLFVQNPVPLNAVAGIDGERLTIRRPEDAVTTIASSDATYSGADLPGVYVVEGGEAPWSFAVNLDPAESRTTPLEPVALEQYGARLTGKSDPAEAAEQRRQMQNAELEGRQKLWRWFILAAIGVLIVETWIAGRNMRPRSAPEEAVSI